MAFGTLQISDLQKSNNQTVAQLGESLVFEAINAALVAARFLLRQKYDSFVTPTTDRLRRYGGPDAMVMQKMDEFGRVDAQKMFTGSNVGFPIDRVGVGLQWTTDFLEEAMASELAEQFVGAQTADVKELDLQIRTALFSPVNYTFTDRLTDNVTLPVKALLNADSSTTGIPLGPNGEVFNGATHTHYLGTAAFATADVAALILTVTQHFGGGQVKLAINQADEASIRAMTPNFQPFVDSRIHQPLTATYATGDLDTFNFNNRDIGVFNAARVIVRPWVPATYMCVYMDNAEQKPLVLREKREGSFGLTLAAEYALYPLHARALRNTYGIGVFNRHSAAVLDTTHATYTLPALAYI